MGVYMYDVVTRDCIGAICVADGKRGQGDARLDFGVTWTTKSLEARSLFSKLCQQCRKWEGGCVYSYLASHTSYIVVSKQVYIVIVKDKHLKDLVEAFRYFKGR